MGKGVMFMHPAHLTQRGKTVYWFIKYILFYNRVVQNKGTISHSI